MRSDRGGDPGCQGQDQGGGSVPAGPPRILRGLIRLFPRPHRRAYGEEMWAVVRHRYGREEEARRARWRLHAGTALDLVGSALGMWTTMTWRRTMERLKKALGGWGLDLRFVGRSLRRSPGYALTAVVVLSGAVAVNASVFGFVRGTLLARPTYPDADRVVVVWGSNPVDGQIRDVLSGPNLVDFARETTSLEALAPLHQDLTTLTTGEHPEPVDDMEVGADFFRAVPVKAALGRVFDERERRSGGQESVLVSWAFFQDRLDGDPSWVGRSLSVEGTPRTIVGVLPQDFEFVAPVPLWIPLHDDELAADSRSRIHYNGVGRLKPGATAADVTRDLSGAMRRISLRTGTYRNWSVLAEPWHQAAVLAVRPILWTVSAAVTLVLLIALVNLATLFRIRTLGRTDELNVRLALGGGRLRVARVLGLEAGGLALAGAALGLVLARPLLARVRELVPLYVQIPDSAARVPVLRAVLDPGVAVVTASMAVLGALALTAPGLVAAVRRRSAAHRGRAAGIRGVRWLVAAELALATVLCLGAGLTTRSADHLLGTDVGLDDGRLLSLWFGDAWGRSAADVASYQRQVLRAVEAVPGVASAAAIDYIPFEGEDDFEGIEFLDRALQPVEQVREEWRRVTQGLFETAGMHILAGRSFGSEDFEGTPRAAVVNEAFARKHYPDGDAVGRFINTGNAAYQGLEIVGVVGDVRSRGAASPAPPMLYVPNQGDPRGTVGMYVRVAAGSPMALLGDVKEAIWSVDPSQPIARVLPMSEVVAQWVAIPRAVRTLVSGLAALALLLAGVGVFGVVAYAVRSRTREMGVRLALGASPDRLKRDVFVDTVPLVMLGVGAGVVTGLTAAWTARAVLHGVAPADPLSLALAVLAMAAAALLATYLPTRRVSRIDPTDAIRSE
ncbi:MAG: ABC transporter permease [Gemmatimonadota bacterium]